MQEALALPSCHEGDKSKTMWTGIKNELLLTKLPAILKSWIPCTPQVLAQKIKEMNYNVILLLGTDFSDCLVSYVLDVPTRILPNQKIFPYSRLKQFSEYAHRPFAT